MGGDLESFGERLRTEEAIHVDRPLARTEQGALYRVEWTGALSETMRGLFDLEFTLLSGEADAERWRFEIRFEDHEAAAEFQSFLVEHGVPHDLTRVQGLADLAPRSVAGLTEKQHEALLEAYDGGVFSVPREMTVDELADRLDIASSSASDRLRRAVERLVEETVITEREFRLAADGSTDRNRG